MLSSFEMNRPYQYWYGGKEKLTFDDELKTTLRRVAQKSGSYPAIPTEAVEKYIPEATS